eukprot:g3631.t1
MQVNHQFDVVKNQQSQDPKKKQQKSRKMDGKVEQENDENKVTTTPSKKRSADVERSSEKKKKKKKNNGNIASFFSKSNVMAKEKKVEKKVVETEKDKESHVVVEDADEDQVVSTSKKRKRRTVIDDDSSDEEEDEKTSTVADESSKVVKEASKVVDEAPKVVDEAPKVVEEKKTNTTFASIFNMKKSKKKKKKKQKIASTSPKKMSNTTESDTVKKKEASPKKMSNTTESDTVKKKETSPKTNETENSTKKKWKQGTPVPYKELTSVFSKIEDTTKRLEITKILEEYFRDVIELTPEDLKASVYLACNKLAPQFENIELGIGDSFLIKAITTSTGRSKKRVKSDYEKSGDLGIVAEQSRSAQKTLFKPKPLTIRRVYEVFRKIANISGNKSQAKKVSEITRLLAACSKEEARFLIRGLQGKLRIGLASQTVNVALATAMTPRNTKKEKVEEAVEIFKKVMSECPSYDLVIPASLNHGISELAKHCHLVEGTPVLPMLAKPTKGASEIFTRFENKAFTCEYKYDGERAQIHLLSNGTVKVFSRNMENNTNKYPDVAQSLPKILKDTVKSI